MKYINNSSISAEEKCTICGNPIEINSSKQHQLLKELIEKNPNKCEECLEKIYAIKAYKDIKEHIPVKAGEYNKISQEFDNVTFRYYLSILKKYDLINSFNQDIFFLKEEYEFYETEIYKKYNPFLEETFKENKTNFVDLDLIMQEEQEIDKLNLNEIDSLEDTKNHKKPINTIKKELESEYEEKTVRDNSNNMENKEVISEDIKEKPKRIIPPTVKHVNISNLLNNSKKSENSKVEYNKESSNKDTIEADKNEVLDNKPLPQIKHINISSLYKSNKGSDSESKSNNTEHEQHDKIINEEPKVENKDSEDIEEIINSDLGIKSIEDELKSVEENVEIKDEISSMVDNVSVKNEFTESIDTFIEEDSEVKTYDNTNEIIEGDSKKTNEIQKEESKHKIPPKKSNGQYSLHKGISYKIGVYKWTADIREKGKLKSLGLFDSEEEAYNARQEYIHKKNPNKKDSEIPPKKSNNRFSLHDRVDYDLNKGKWFAYVHEYGYDKFLGYFNTEKEAYSEQCKYLNIFVPTKQKNGQYSLHNGVSFNKRYCKWTSTIRGRKKNKFLGYFCSELDALKAIEVYEESKGKILNIWTPPKDLSDELKNDLNENKFIKTFSYEPVGKEYMQITLNGQINEDNELFEVLYKLNSFFIKINTLEIKDRDDFISLRASFKIKSDVLNKLVMMLNEDSWIKK